MMVNIGKPQVGGTRLSYDKVVLDAFQLRMQKNQEFLFVLGSGYHSLFSGRLYPIMVEDNCHYDRYTHLQTHRPTYIGIRKPLIWGFSGDFVQCTMQHRVINATAIIVEKAIFMVAASGVAGGQGSSNDNLMVARNRTILGHPGFVNLSHEPLETCLP